MTPEGRAIAIAALLKMHPPSVVAKMIRNIDEGKSPTEAIANSKED